MFSTDHSTPGYLSNWFQLAQLRRPFTEWLT